MLSSRMVKITWLCSPLVLLGLLLHAHLGHAGFEHSCTLETRHNGPHRFGICGNRIYDTLMALCPRGLAPRRGFKRSLPAMISPADDTKAENENNDLPGMMLSKRAALSYLQAPRTALSNTLLARHKRHGVQGITCECCYHRCSLRELYQYCN